MMTNYRLGTEFPREGFVQAALERHFSACARESAGHADLACRDENGQRWLIEAKGETSDVGLDFRTGLGQVLQGTPSPEWRPALAMPDTPKFERQRARTPEWVRSALGLHWVLVDASGTIRVVPPARAT
jgi:hypothetical protein